VFGHSAIFPFFGGLKRAATQKNQDVRALPLYQSLQFTVILCNTLQHTATPIHAHCNTLQPSTTKASAHYQSLQHTVVHCNTLQHSRTHTATRCNVASLQLTVVHCALLALSLAVDQSLRRAMHYKRRLNYRYDMTRSYA